MRPGDRQSGYRDDGHEGQELLCAEDKKLNTQEWLWSRRHNVEDNRWKQMRDDFDLKKQHETHRGRDMPRDEAAPRAGSRQSLRGGVP